MIHPLWSVENFLSFIKLLLFFVMYVAHYGEDLPAGYMWCAQPSWNARSVLWSGVGHSSRCGFKDRLVRTCAIWPQVGKGQSEW